MKIFRWNDRISHCTWKAHFFASDRPLMPVCQGNPFLEEPLLYSWETVRNAEVALTVTFSSASFLDAVVVRTSEETALRYVRLLADGVEADVYSAETGKTVSEHTLKLVAGVKASEITLLFCCDFSELGILSVDLYGSESEKRDLFPIPKNVCFGAEELPVAALTSYTAQGEALLAGEILRDKLADIGIDLSKKDDGFVRFLQVQDLPFEGYRLSVTLKDVTVEAADTRGFIMGAESLLKLIKDQKLPTVTVEDAPFAPFRGVHLLVPSRAQLPFAKRLIRNVISPLGYNVVILELAGLGMRFDSHPKIAETVEAAIEKSRRGEMPTFPHGEGIGDGRAVEKAVLKEFVDYIRSFGIEVVPEVQSLGHVQFMTYTYPEIAEIDPERAAEVDVRLADALPAQVYPHCYCPSNPRSYEILFDLLDEVIELFAPLKYVHIGHDEVYQIGVCPICQKTPPEELFYRDVMKIYDYLAARGIKTMMWADMLQPVTKYKTWGAASRLPRDIVMLDFIWYFHLDKDIEENLLPYGFPVAFGNLYSSHFPRFESRIRKNGIIGGQISMWAPTTEKAIAREGKFYDICMVAQMLWDGGYSHAHRPSYERMIASLMPQIRERIKEIRYPSLEADAAKISLSRLDDERFTCREGGDTFRSLLLTHTLRTRYARLPWKEFESIGAYRLTYCDGTVDTVEICNGREVGECSARPWQPLENPLYRHNGYTACYECDRELLTLSDGTRVTAYRYEYLLPHQKLLKTVEWVEKSDTVKMEVLKIEGVC